VFGFFLLTQDRKNRVLVHPVQSVKGPVGPKVSEGKIM